DAHRIGHAAHQKSSSVTWFDSTTAGRRGTHRGPQDLLGSPSSSVKKSSSISCTAKVSRVVAPTPNRSIRSASLSPSISTNEVAEPLAAVFNAHGGSPGGRQLTHDGPG